MKIAISAGHAKHCQGAVGPSPWGLNEVDEARRVTTDVANMLIAAGILVEFYWDDVSTSQNENLNRIVDWHNDIAFGGASHDLDISVHFNAYDVTSKPMGCEVCYLTQSALASEVSAAMAEAQDLPNRGGKYRGDLFFLNSTSAPAILLEVCFVDSSTDAEHYRNAFDQLITAIAEAVGDVVIDSEPPEPEQPPEEIPPPELSEENRVAITSSIDGDVTIYINDTLVTGHEDCEHTVDLQIKLTGDVVLSINGEDFHSSPTAPEAPSEIPSWQSDIEATVFGGGSDINYSAYPPYDQSGNGAYLNDTALYVALPYRFEGERPHVRVYHGELSAEASIEDVGPWCTTNPYWLLHERPLAEQCFYEAAPLPAGSGPNAGTVPTNKAGIDLSPALASKIGVNGKGKVDWEFVD
jgi:N-acetylmuramoyl-L-alanine amidase